MSHYLFVQSQDPFTETRTHHQFDLIGQLHDAGHQVAVLLVQNGVTPARRGAKSDLFDDLLRWGVTVRADQFALAQREIDHADLKDQIGVADMDLVIDAMLAGHKVIWH